MADVSAKLEYYSVRFMAYKSEIAFIANAGDCRNTFFDLTTKSKKFPLRPPVDLGVVRFTALSFGLLAMAKLDQLEAGLQIVCKVSCTIRKSSRVVLMKAASAETIST
ncbi:hypothetical protein ACLPHM_15495 [Paenalcaligenes sp. Me131]|uniref:hypothetical protein n=1 Tax=Paenalcaligenes sp. Me131 TaxID=3392636 RepID=UPI003D2714A9